MGADRGIGRGERIRTSDLSVPNRAHYQAVLRPVFFEKCLVGRPAILATAGSAGQGEQIITRGIKRLSPMTNSVFDTWRQLGKG